MSDFTIPDKTLETTVDRAADDFLLYDASAAGLRRTRVNNMLNIAGAPVGDTDTQTLTNKTLTSPTINAPTLVVNDNAFTIRDNSDTTKIVDFQLSGITTGNTRTITVPDASITLVGTAATQTLTNKTLTSPTITNPTLTVDTISEFTGANGVTIDGLNIKDGALVTANSVPNNTLSNTGTFGSAWAWTSFTPSWTNLTPGNGTNSGYYHQIGKTVFFKTRFVMGSTSSMGSAPTLTLPITASGNVMANSDTIIGSVNILDNGTARYGGRLIYASTTTVTAQVDNTAGTYLTPNGITSTAPMTWTTNDTLNLYGFYEAA